MDNIKNDNAYINKILEDLDFIIEHMDRVSYEDFAKQDLLQGAMFFRLIQISENTKCLSESYKNSKKEIDWMALTGLRNRIVHDYGNVVLNIVYDALTVDIPELRHQLEK